MAFKMRSGNKPNFKDLGSSPMKSIRSAAFGRNRDDVFESYGEGADVSHKRRTNFEHPANTKEGQAERRAHQRYLERRSRQRLSIDLKADRRQSQLRGPGGERDIKRGVEEITDPWGNKHRINRKGGKVNFMGSTWGYDEKSRDWRRNYNKPKVEKPESRDKKVTVKTRPAPKVKTQKPTTKIKKPTTVKPAPKPKKKEFATRGDAFKAARAAGKAKFSYKGKEYHTRRADETKADWQKKFGTKAASPGPEPKVKSTPKIKPKKTKPKVSLPKDKGLMKSKTNIKIKKVSLKGKGEKSLKEKLEELKKK